jgi:hypothetical protein
MRRLLPVVQAFALMHNVLSMQTATGPRALEIH